MWFLQYMILTFWVRFKPPGTVKKIYPNLVTKYLQSYLDPGVTYTVKNVRT